MASSLRRTLQGSVIMATGVLFFKVHYAIIGCCHHKPKLKRGNKKWLMETPTTNKRKKLFMDSKICFRLSKSGQNIFKSRVYHIRVNGNPIGEINSRNSSLSQNLPNGKHTVEIGEEDFFIRKDVVLSGGQMQTITINPSLRARLFRWILFGIAFITILVQLFIIEKSSLLLILIPIIPLIVFRPKDHGERFVLTFSNL